MSFWAPEMHMKSTSAAEPNAVYKGVLGAVYEYFLVAFGWQVSIVITTLG